MIKKFQSLSNNLSIIDFYLIGLSNCVHVDLKKHITYHMIIWMSDIACLETTLCFFPWVFYLGVHMKSKQGLRFKISFIQMPSSFNIVLSSALVILYLFTYVSLENSLLCARINIDFYVNMPLEQTMLALVACSITKPQLKIVNRVQAFSIQFIHAKKWGYQNSLHYPNTSSY